MLTLPNTTPKITREEILKKISFLNVSQYPLAIIGIRGYYENTMGEAGKNDRGIYDDAIILISTNVYATFNGNTDPSIFRKDIASLKEGTYYAHNFGMHKGKYLALVQRSGEVVITRDGQVGEQKGYFGINIHKGGLNGTSSEGCQTIHPYQWESFITIAKSEAMRLFGKDNWDKKIIPYILF